MLKWNICSVRGTIWMILQKTSDIICLLYSLSTASWTELSRLLERRHLKKAWIWWGALIYESSPWIVKGKTRISSSWSSFCDSDSVYTIVAYIKLACKLIVLPQAHLLICNLSRILYTDQILIFPEHKCDHLNSFSIVCLHPPSFDQRFTSFGIFQVSKWFKNARYMALKIRKVGCSNPQVTLEPLICTFWAKKRPARCTRFLPLRDLGRVRCTRPYTCKQRCCFLVSNLWRQGPSSHFELSPFIGMMFRKLDKLGINYLHPLFL